MTEIPTTPVVITCLHCGSDRFAAGVIEPCPDGGFDVFMPCAACGTPNPVLHDSDPEMAQMLLSFFANNGETLTIEPERTPDGH